MSRITNKERERAFEAVESCYAIRDKDAFLSGASAVVNSLVPGDFMSIVSMDMDTMLVKDLRWTPPEMPMLEYWETYKRFCHEDVVLSHYLSTFDKQLVLVSDLISPAKLHKLSLYTDCMKPFGMEDGAYFELDSGPDGLVVLCHARGKTFTTKERRLLCLIMPHLKAVYRNLGNASMPFLLMERGRMFRRFSARAAPDGRLVQADPETYAFLSGQGLLENASGGSRFSKQVAGYIKKVADLFATGRILNEWISPLDIGGSGGLNAFCMPDSVNGCYTLVFKHCESIDMAKAMRGKGLTRRECEVLSFVAQGRTNEDIGEFLGISRQTVRVHLEHIFDKLGVDTRTAAAAAAFERLMDFYSSKR